MTVRIAGALPKEWRQNGADGLTYELSQHPARPQAFIIICDVAKTTKDHDTGELSPTLRVLHIERVRAADLVDAENLLRSAQLVRTGRSNAQLPLDTPADDDIALLMRRVRDSDDTPTDA